MKLPWNCQKERKRMAYSERFSATIHLRYGNYLSGKIARNSIARLAPFKTRLKPGLHRTNEYKWTRARIIRFIKCWNSKCSRWQEKRILNEKTVLVMWIWVCMFFLYEMIQLIIEKTKLVCLVINIRDSNYYFNLNVKFQVCLKF